MSARAMGDLFVGQHIVLEGTGRRWYGHKFTATIVDIRPEDDTVKVQYRDGGFKRFTKPSFNQCRVDSGANPAWDYGSQAYEWYFENYAPDRGEENSASETLGEYRSKIAVATRAGDFETAAKLQEQFKRQQSLFVEGQRLKEQLLAAVQAEDFLKAHEAKSKLEKFRFERKKSVGSSGSSTSAALEATKKEQKPLGEILQNAGKRALGGGVAGASAMIIQVSTLMWMRTAMNYQYRYGMSTTEALRTLYKEGGVLRFYRGYFAAIAQGPLSRFGDTAANAGVLALLESNASTSALPTAVKTVFASGMAATWRIALTPVDTVKTIMQVEGRPGLDILFKKARTQGPTVYFHGAMAAAAATFAGHYPWFATYNTLQENLPQYTELHLKLLRNAGIGFVSSAISDTVSNSLRVVKTYRQTYPEPISYTETVKAVVEKDGYAGLFGRGLQTRIIANGMQGLMFSVMWKIFDDEIKKRKVFG